MPLLRLLVSLALSILVALMRPSLLRMMNAQGPSLMLFQDAFASNIGHEGIPHLPVPSAHFDTGLDGDAFASLSMTEPKIKHDAHISNASGLHDSDSVEEEMLTTTFTDANLSQCHPRRAKGNGSTLNATRSSSRAGNGDDPLLGESRGIGADNRSK